MYTHSGDLITYPPFRENSMYHKVYAFSFCLSVEAITGVVIKSACPEIGFVVQSCPTLCDSHRLQHTRSPCPSLFSWPNFMAPLHGSLPCCGEGACVTQRSYKPRRKSGDEPPKTDGSQGRVLTKILSTGGGNSKPPQYSCTVLQYS